MLTNLKSILAALAVVTLIAFSSSAFAGTLANSTLSIPAFTGNSVFDSDPNDNVGVDQLDGSLDYAVYTAANFALEWGAAFIPGAGNNYIYAFQVFNDGPGEDFVSAEINAPVDPAAQGLIDSFEEVASDIAPAAPFVSFVGASAQWIFTDPVEGSVDNGEQSAILVYSSPFGPVPGFSVTINGGEQAQTYAPVPGIGVPEPTCFALLFAGTLLGVLPRRK